MSSGGKTLSSFRVPCPLCSSGWLLPLSRGEATAHAIQPLLGALTTCAHQCDKNVVQCAGHQVGSSAHTHAVHGPDGREGRMPLAAGLEEVSRRPGMAGLLSRCVRAWGSG